jgi:hypothetical protein
MDLERVLKALDNDVVAPRPGANDHATTANGRNRGRGIYGDFILGLSQCLEDAITASSTPHSSKLLTKQSSWHRDRPLTELLHKGKDISAF